MNEESNELHHAILMLTEKIHALELHIQERVNTVEKRLVAIVSALVASGILGNAFLTGLIR